MEYSVYAYVALLVLLVAVLIACIRAVGAEGRRRKQSWAAYYDRPDRAYSKVQRPDR